MRQAVAGTLHNVIYGHLDVEFDSSILNNDELLERVASRNAEMNGVGGELGRTYLLSQVIEKSRHYCLIRVFAIRTRSRTKGKKIPTQLEIRAILAIGFTFGANVYGRLSSILQNKCRTIV